MSMVQVTQETIEMMKNALAKSAQTTTGFNQATGLTGYDLEAPSKKLFPVLSPHRNTIPRKKAKVGSQAAHWKAITKINANNASATTGFGYAGNTVATATQDFLAPYKVISLGDTVQYDAQIQAREFEDLRATSGINLLYALMIEEDKLIKFGQAYSLGTPAAPTLVPAGTGGTIGAVNVGIAVAARTGQGWYTGQTTAASTPAASGTLSGTTNSIAATVASVRGAVCYDWYVGLNGGTLYYYGTTTVNKITITSVPTQAQPVNPLDPTINTVTPPPNTAPATDSSADANASNGLLSSLTGSFDTNGGLVAYGSAQSTPTGAYVKSLDGAVLNGDTGTIAEIDTALAYIWVTAKLSPSKIRVNALDHVNISKKIISTGGVYTLFRPTDVGERQHVVGGQLVETYLNKYVNGRPIPLETDPWLMQGTIIIETAELPYPNNEVSNVMEIETQLEYTQIEYATARAGGASGGPRYDFEVRAQQVFKNYFPGSMAILQNVGNG